jgi:hypothetical protein
MGLAVVRRPASPSGPLCRGVRGLRLGFVVDLGVSAHEATPLAPLPLQIGADPCGAGTAARYKLAVRAISSARRPLPPIREWHRLVARSRPILPAREDNRRLIAKVPRCPRLLTRQSWEGMVVPPAWLTIVAWLYLSICFCCAAVIAYDIFINNRRQPMGVMNAVFPITALYFGPLAVAFYWRWGRVASNAAPVARRPASEREPSMSSVGADMSSAGTDIGMPMRMDDDRSPHRAVDPGGPVTAAGSRERSRPRWAMMATEVSHCGSGCVLGDVIAEFVIFGLVITIAGAVLPVEYIGDFVLALAFGIVF